MATNICSPGVANDGGVERKLEAAGWGLFFVWVGAAIMTNVGWGTGLIGVGVIILLGQVARKRFGVRVGRLPIVVGSFFVLGGTGDLFTIQFSPVPVLCIIAGLAMLVSAVVRNRRG
jgi:hypothetical protein